MPKGLKKIPDFSNEDEEREFWAHHSSTDYVDWSKAKFVSFPNLQPSTKTISLRLPESLLDSIRVQAHKLDVPYQSLMKVWLAERASAPQSTSSRGKK